MQKVVYSVSNNNKERCVRLSSPFIGNRRLCNPLIISSALPISL